MIQSERSKESSNGGIAAKMDELDLSREDLEEVADSDLPISNVARDLLDVLDGDAK